ncbi:MAG: YcaO-like family protein [Ilumatobacteraceae bacterium]
MTTPTSARAAAPNPCTDAREASEAYDSLVDARSGIVARTWPEQLPTFGPPGLRICLAQLSPTDRFAAPLGSDTTAGCAWWDDDAARRAAIGEAVEWYCASLVPADLPLVSAEEIAPTERVNIADLALYRPEQTAAPGFPFRAFTGDVRVRWVTGHHLDGQPCQVPASLVYLGYGSGPTANETLTNLPVNAGVAAALEPAAALSAALAEVVERDALAEAWTFGQPLVPLTIPDALHAQLAADDQTTWRFYRLPSSVEVAAVLAVVHRPCDAVFGVGAAVRGDGEAAARKAAAEAMVAASGCIEINRADSRQCARLIDDGGPLSPWRADRRYRDSYRADWRDAVDIACHAQLYVDPEMQHRALDRLDTLAGVRRPEPLLALPALELSTLPDLLHERGFSPIVCDVTTPDVASLGWHVRRAVVPGLRATGPAAFPYLGETARSRTHDLPLHLEPVPHV